MSDLIIRQFREEHHAGVVKLWQETLGDQQSWNEPSYIIERKVAQNDGLSFVSESVGEIVATVLAGYDGIRGWIYSMAVADTHRRSGFGCRMMNAAEQELLSRGCPKTNLQVRVTNSVVVSFYEQLGYRAKDRLSMGKALPVEREVNHDK